jgi:hypothetical protein
MPFGTKWTLGVQHVTEPDPGRRYHPGRTILVGALVIVAVVVMYLAFPAQHHATPVTTARVTPVSTPTMATVPLTDLTTGVCILPTAVKVKVVKVP